MNKNNDSMKWLMLIATVIIISVFLIIVIFSLVILNAEKLESTQITTIIRDLIVILGTLVGSSTGLGLIIRKFIDRGESCSIDRIFTSLKNDKITRFMVLTFLNNWDKISSPDTSKTAGILAVLGEEDE